MHALDRFRGWFGRALVPAEERELVLVVTMFFASRAAAYVAGVRFDAEHLASFWHFAPLHLLEERLVETVFYLHFQPPLFNLYLGLVVKTFGAWSTVAFGASFFLLGLVTALALFVLMRRVGVAGRVALALTALFTLCPATILFENFLFYELPVTALVVFAALALQVAAKSGRTGAWAVFFGLLAALVLVRALFHPLVMLAAALGAVVAFATQRRAILSGFLVPALLVGSVCVKNGVIFDSFGTSSWLGMGLARMTLRNIDAEKKATWVRDGIVSPAAQVHPPSDLDEYARVMRLSPSGDFAASRDPTGIPVLDEPRKPRGDLNLHHLAYARISKLLIADAWVALRREPGVYIDAVRSGLARFFQPSSTWHPLAPNRKRIVVLDRVYNAVVHFGEWGGPMIVLFPGAMLWGLLRCRRPDLGLEHRAVVAFMLGVMAWVLLAGTLLEPVENMRFRHSVEPFVWTLLGLMVTGVGAPRARASQRAAIRAEIVGNGRITRRHVSAAGVQLSRNGRGVRRGLRR